MLTVTSTPYFLKMSTHSASIRMPLLHTPRQISQPVRSWMASKLFLQRDEAALGKEQRLAAVKDDGELIELEIEMCSSSASQKASSASCVSTAGFL